MTVLNTCITFTTLEKKNTNSFPFIIWDSVFFAPFAMKSLPNF